MSSVDRSLRGNGPWQIAGRDRSQSVAPPACPGIATSFVLRCIAHHVGTFAPRTHDEILDEPCSARHGSSLTAVERWFTGRGRMLHWLGYHLRCRRMASPTRDLVAWLEAGCGYRGAVLATSHERLHPGTGTPPGDALAHAVGLALETGEPAGAARVVVFDPCSHATGAAGISPTLDLAHADRDHQALAFHWIGWS
jgi:hypothetical protein